MPTSTPAGRGRMNGAPAPCGPIAPSSRRRHQLVKPSPPASPRAATATPGHPKSPASDTTIRLSAMSCATTTTAPRRRSSARVLVQRNHVIGGGHDSRIPAGFRLLAGATETPRARPSHADGGGSGRGDHGCGEPEPGDGGRRGGESVRRGSARAQSAVDLTGEVHREGGRLLETALTGLDQHDDRPAPSPEGGPDLTLLRTLPGEGHDIGHAFQAHGRDGPRCRCRPPWPRAPRPRRPRRDTRSRPPRRTARCPGWPTPAPPCATGCSGRS